MNTAEIELFLAKLYTDEALLKRFVMNPAAELATYDLSSESIASLLELDLQDVQLAAHSYAHKRSQYQGRRSGWLQRFVNYFSNQKLT